MRICQISDIHWRGIARHPEYTRSFEQLIRDLREKIKPDIIVNTGDTFHTKTQGITPEIIERLSWMFRELADIAPTYHLLGNHDGNLTNLTRSDMITPIHDAVNHPNSFLLRDTGRYKIPGHNVVFDAYSPFDKEKYSSLKNPSRSIEDADTVFVALYHGSTDNCIMDNNWVMPEGEVKVTDFAGYDFVLMGDIHKRQNIAYRLDKNDTPKPWIAYPGSFIQQSFGEEESKGVLVWDIQDRNTWDISFHEIKNYQPFISIEWADTANETIKNLIESRGGKDKLLPGSRYRIVSKGPVPEIQERQVLSTLKDVYRAEEVMFKSEFISRLDDISTNSVMVNKKSLRTDSEALYSLYEEYIRAHSDSYKLSPEQMLQAKAHIAAYLAKLNNTTPETPTSSVWSLRWIEFDNVFGYGPGNRINLDSMNGIVGIFGPNRAGKSSIIGAICYALFNGTDRGSIKNIDVINKDKAYCSATARFTVGGTDYIVERKTTRTLDKHKSPIPDKVTNTVNLFEILKLEDGTELKRSKNSISTTDTDKEIRRLIGTQEDFLLTAFAAQGDLNRFISEGATKRKKHLGRFLELDIFEKLYEYAKEDAAELGKSSTLLSEEEWIKKISEFEHEIEGLEKAISSIELEKKSLNNERDSIKIWVSQHDAEANQAQLAKQFAELQNSLDKISQEQLKLQEQLAANSLGLKKAQEALLTGQTTLASLDTEETLLATRERQQTLRQSHLVAKHHVDSQAVKVANLEASAKKLTLVPCGDSFPTCQFIHDSHVAKSEIGVEKQKLTEAQAELERLERELLAVTSVDSVLKTVRDTKALIAREQASIDLHQEKQVSLDFKLASNASVMTVQESALKEIESKLSMEQSAEYQSKQDLLSQTEKAIYVLEQQVSGYLQNIGALKVSLSNSLKEKERSENLLQRLAIYQSIQDALSKRGIPAMVLATQLPAINQEVNNLLASVVDFRIELETDISSNDMDIYLSSTLHSQQKTNGKRIIELCSGMEKTICSMALRVALINLSSLARPNFFVIDEGFTALDESNMESVLGLLKQISSYFKSVLVISHVSPIKEAADTIIEITNNGFESNVQA